MDGVKTKRKDYQRKFKLETVFLVLLCITELMVPSLGAVCDVTDGSEANSVACTISDWTRTSSGCLCYNKPGDTSCECCKSGGCQNSNGKCIQCASSCGSNSICACGSVECTSTTGFICYSTYGSGSCRKMGFGPFGYIKEEGDKMCVDESNRGLLLGKAACEAAATSMDLDDVVASEISHSDYPPGCFWRYSSLRYNTLFTSTTSCTHNSDFCLCIAAPDCTQTNGATSNTDTCFCGETGVRCTAASGLFCDASNTYGHCSNASNLIGLWIVLGIGLSIIVVFICYRIWNSKRSSNYATSHPSNSIWKPKRSSNNMASTDSAATFASASAELEAIFARDSMGAGDKQRETELVEILKQFTPIPVTPDSNTSTRSTTCTTESISVSVSDSAVSSKEIIQ